MTSALERWCTAEAERNSEPERLSRLRPNGHGEGNNGECVVTQLGRVAA